MTVSTPVEEVVALLSRSGSRPLPLPLAIAGMTFDLPAALIGQSPSPDLILVADLAFEAEQRILRKVEGVARALDVTRSRRPLTTVLVGLKPTAATLDAMTRVCRVLPIGVMEAGTASELLTNWLAVLLPLELPAVDNNTRESVSSIIERSSDLDARVVDVVQFAEQGSAKVQSALHSLLNSALATPAQANEQLEDDEDQEVVAEHEARGVFE